MPGLSPNEVLPALLLCAAVALAEVCTFDLRSSQCPSNEICKESAEGASNGTCVCGPGFVRSAGAAGPCIRRPPAEVPIEAGNHVAAAVIGSLAAVVIIVAAVYYGKKYRFINWVRYKVKRHMTSYDDVMIGQDEEE